MVEIELVRVSNLNERSRLILIRRHSNEKTQTTQLVAISLKAIQVVDKRHLVPTPNRIDQPWSNNVETSQTNKNININENYNPCKGIGLSFISYSMIFLFLFFSHVYFLSKQDIKLIYAMNENIAISMQRKTNNILCTSMSLFSTKRTLNEVLVNNM